MGFGWAIGRASRRRRAPPAGTLSVARVRDQALGRAPPLALPALHHALAGALAVRERTLERVEQHALVTPGGVAMADPAQAEGGDRDQLAREVEHATLRRARPQPPTRHGVEELLALGGA